MNRFGGVVLVGVVVLVCVLVVRSVQTNRTVARDNANAYIIGCKHTNAVGHSLLDNQIARSLKSYALTVESNTSTATDIAKATASLQGLRDYQRHQRAVLSDKNCVYPPIPLPVVPDPTTTSVAGTSSTAPSTTTGG